MSHREPFDHKRPLVAARDFTFAGVPYKPGEPFPEPGVDVSTFARRLIERQYSAMAVNHAPLEQDEAELEDALKMTGPSGGRYTITAPWLDEPLVVRGKLNADTKFAEMKDEGAPLGFIAGGSLVEIEEGGGGWYQITAPWLDEPEKRQGRDAAEARQREIHAAGEPDNYKGVTLTAGDNGWFVITRDGSDVELKVHGEEQARADAATLRAGGTIDGDPLPPEQEGAGDDDKAGQGAETGSEAPPPPADPAAGADANSANAGTSDAAATGAAEQTGTDGPEKSEGAESGAEGKDDGEAGKSKDDPADA